MRNRLVLALGFVTFFAPRLYAQEGPGTRLNQILLNQQKRVFVAAHRGDWRDAPENSVQSLQWAVKLGVDIVEFDVKRTRDGSLVVMHDFDVDRTTTGHGLVSDLTLDQIKQIKLRAGTGHPTKYTVPTLSEELRAAFQNHVILDIDTGWDYFKDVVAQVREERVTDQVILNVFHNTTLETLEQRVGKIPEDLTIMVVVNMERPDADVVVRSYARHHRTIVQCDFKDATIPAVKKIPEYRKSTPIWMNSLWPEQNSGHDDDRALDPGPPDQAWGWLLAHGANVIQTDRAREFLEYLRADNLH